MAEVIPNATLIEIDSGDHLPFYDKPDEIIGHIQTFLTGGTTPDLPESRVATLMFTDIVGSTETAVAKGDLRFGDFLEVHHASVRAELGRYRGEEVNTAGDGFFWLRLTVRRGQSGAPWQSGRPSARRGSPAASGSILANAG
jgi:class 3 adenylate cyclase